LPRLFHRKNRSLFRHAERLDTCRMTPVLFLTHTLIVVADGAAVAA